MQVILGANRLIVWRCDFHLILTGRSPINRRAIDTRKRTACGVRHERKAT